MTSIDHDQLFKQLLETFFIDFIELFAPALPAYLKLSELTFLPQQYFTDILDGERKAIDILASVPIQTNQTPGQQITHTILVHIENQATSRANFTQRMFFYFAELYRQYRVPIYPIVVFSFNEPKRPEPYQHCITLPELEVLTFNFHPIQLNRLNWRDFLQHHNPVAAALMAKMNIAKQDRPKVLPDKCLRSPQAKLSQVKVECLRLLANLQLDTARTFFISGFVDTYLRLNQSEEKVFQAEIAKIQIDTERENVMQLTTSWMERGIQQGIEQGIEQGLERERRDTITSLMILRFGDIDDRLTTILPNLMALNSSEYNRLLLELSKDELISYFHSNQESSIN